MLDVLKIAGRNLSRYRRRTMLTLLLIIIGMVAVLLFISVTGSFKAMMVGRSPTRCSATWRCTARATWRRSTRCR